MSPTPDQRLRLDRTEVLRALKVLTEPDQVTELRILKMGNLRTVSGFFDRDHHGDLAEAAASYDTTAPGIFVTMNPVDRALLGRANNRVKVRAEETTADQHILKRRFLLLDGDPVRASAVSSSNSEHDTALAFMWQIAIDLGTEGWPKPILGDSGNGAHLLFAVDLPNDPTTKQLIQNVLKALAKRFDTDTVRLDQSVHNASRLVKLYGSVARKGDSTPDRPHRLSRLLEIPSHPATIPFKLLEETARQVERHRSAPYPTFSPRNNTNTNNDSPAIHRFDLAEWITKNSLPVREPVPYDGGLKWQFDCPFNPEHRAPDAFIAQLANGALIFHCSHNSCADYHWREFRDKIEGNEAQSPSKITRSIEDLVAEVRATKDVRLPYESIETMAKLSDAELAIVYQELKSILGRKLIQTDFRSAVKEVRARQRNANAEPANQPHLSRHPYGISDGGMVRVTAKKGGTEIIPLANFVATIKKDITEDDGLEARRFFEIEATLRDRTFVFIIPASELPAMNWPIERIGPAAIVNPNQKDWARAAVQTFSTDVQEQRIFTHTGWRKVGEVVLYLHGAGAIGASGAVPNVDVRLSGPLAHYQLDLPQSNQALVEAIQASLRMVGLTTRAAEHIAFVVLAAVYRACLRGCDFSIWIAGPTGVFKTEVAALAQQHFGPAMNSRRLPGNFSSTGNSLEVLAFSAKDALMVIDDFAPHGNMQDVARYHAAADRILRAAGNNQGRGRLSSDARLREAKAPRGLIIATGEDLPRGQSIRGRTFMIEIAQGDIEATALTNCQAEAASGAYARATAGFIRAIAAQYDKIQNKYPADFAEQRAKATHAHARTPGIVADLFLGFTSFLDFALDVGAISNDVRDDLAERCWNALQKVARAQRVRQEASEPARHFLDLLRAAIVAGDAHVSDLKGEHPAEAPKWGWRMMETGELQRWIPAGKCIGWLEGSSLYLEPKASYAVAQEMGRRIGEPLVVSEMTLRKRLHEEELLASVDMTRETLKVRKCVQGRETLVLHLPTNALESPRAGLITDQGNTEEFKC
jgi:hypothetical protein